MAAEEICLLSLKKMKGALQLRVWKQEGLVGGLRRNLAALPGGEGQKGWRERLEIEPTSGSEQPTALFEQGKGAQWTRLTWEERPKMLNGMKQRIRKA